MIKIETSDILIMQTILYNKSLNRNQMSKITGYTYAHIHNRVKNLLETGFLIKDEENIYTLSNEALLLMDTKLRHVKETMLR